MLLGPHLPRFREGRLLRRAMVDADRPGASPAFAGAGSCRRGPPALPRSRRLRALQVEDGDQHLKALRSPRVSRQDRRRVPNARALGSFAVAHPRLANRDRADAGHDLAFRKMAVAHDALLARLGLEIGMLCEKLSNLRFDGLSQQRTRAAAQDLREGIGKGPWLGGLDDVSLGHGVSLLHWRSGGVEHHHDTPPYPITPSPTSGHSSKTEPACHSGLRVAP